MEHPFTDAQVIAMGHQLMQSLKVEQHVTVIPKANETQTSYF
jgi:hypothetical protein